MSTFIYGVFEGTNNISRVLSSLKADGLTDVVVLKDSKALAYNSATLHPTKKTPFIIAGTIGGVLGAIVGAIASPTVPYTNTFQLITPIMAMVSGSVIFAYLAFWLAGFLYWIDRPVIENEVFEGTIPNGSVLLGVTVECSAQKVRVMECLDSNGAVEIIARNTALVESPLERESELLKAVPSEKLVA